MWRRRTIPARALVTVSPVKAETVQRSKTQVVERETERDQGEFQREKQDSERFNEDRRLQLEAAGKTGLTLCL